MKRQVLIGRRAMVAVVGLAFCTSALGQADTSRETLDWQRDALETVAQPLIDQARKVGQQQGNINEVNYRMSEVLSPFETMAGPKASFATSFTHDKKRNIISLSLFDNPWIGKVWLHTFRDRRGRLQGDIVVQRYSKRGIDSLDTYTLKLRSGFKRLRTSKTSHWHGNLSTTKRTSYNLGKSPIFTRSISTKRKNKKASLARRINALHRKAP